MNSNTISKLTIAGLFFTTTQMAEASFSRYEGNEPEKDRFFETISPALTRACKETSYAFKDDKNVYVSEDGKSAKYLPLSKVEFVKALVYIYDEPEVIPCP